MPETTRSWGRRSPGTSAGGFGILGVHAGSGPGTLASCLGFRGVSKCVLWGAAFVLRSAKLLVEHFSCLGFAGLIFAVVACSLVLQG